VSAYAIQFDKPTRDLDAFGIQLRCPQCRAAIDGVRCSHCSFALEERNGVLRALPPERVAYYARFIADYERIRAAEGRSAATDDFYLALPYCDLTGNNSKQWLIRARSFDHMLRRILRPSLKENARVLDLGAGNGWMSFRLALAGYSPFAVDLLTNTHDGLGAAEHYRGALPNMFPRFQAEMMHLPFADRQFDAVIFNASFHYVEDAEAAVREALRCVRSGGLVVICDTPWYAREASGQQMIEERRAAFLKTYGTASDSIKSVEFLTTDRLRMLEQSLSIRWTTHAPSYGFKWALRPLMAKLRRKREPSRFRIYVTRKSA
jgi:SAM-dependent methyltransferase